MSAPDSAAPLSAARSLRQGTKSWLADWSAIELDYLGVNRSYDRAQAQWGGLDESHFMGHAPRSFYPIANQGETAILLCFIFLYIAFAGGGPWSVDRAVLKQD